jgi:hypothetical protein
MALWQVTVRLPGGDRRQVLREIRGRAGVVIRGVQDTNVTLEVAAVDEVELRRHWPGSESVSVMRVDGGWSGDWWDGDGPGLLGSDEVLGPADGSPDGDVVVSVPFHHFAVDHSDRRLTLFWNGSSCEAGPATADEREDGVIVTVTERRPRGARAAVGEGRRTTRTLRTALGARPVWERRPGVARPSAYP